MARALGFRFCAHDRELNGNISDLRVLTRIVPSPQSSPSGRGGREATGEGIWRLLKITAAADVRNPLLGENGATRVFGPQKGATDDKIEILERALAKLADVVSKECGVDYRDEPGAGAAGGLGFGLMSFCGAKIRPGFELVAETAELESRMKDVDLVITGEGSLDPQTLQGKTPAGIARLARKLGKPVFAVAGCTDENLQVRELFDGVYVLGQPGMSENEKMKRATELLREKAQELAKNLSG